MTSKKIASDTVKVQLSKLTLDNNRLLKKVEELETENKGLRKQNVELASVIENDLKADLKLKIMAMSNFKESDLEQLPVEQLQTIDETLSKSKGGGAVYKPIRAGDASTGSGRLTVGSLYGKTRDEILASGGEF
jgi:hypothetical protein